VGDWVVLVCAVLGSLAAGVLAAFGVTQAVFGVFRVRAAERSTQPEVQVSVAATIVEG
jgi:hypothetical protein